MLTSWHTTTCVCFLYLNKNDLALVIEIFCGFLPLPIPPVCFQYHSICDGKLDPSKTYLLWTVHPTFCSKNSSRENVIRLFYQPFWRRQRRHWCGPVVLYFGLQHFMRGISTYSRNSPPEGPALVPRAWPLICLWCLWSGCSAVNAAVVCRLTKPPSLADLNKENHRIFRCCDHWILLLIAIFYCFGISRFLCDLSDYVSYWILWLFCLFPRSSHDVQKCL